MAKTERFGIPTRQEDTLLYAGEGINAVPTVHAQRDPTILDRKYPMQTIWRNDVTLDEWMHLDTINGDAIWRKLMGAAGATTTISDTADTVVSPDITGNIQLAGGDGMSIISSPGTNSLALAPNKAQAIAATDPTKVGAVAMNNAQFTVDANGFVSLAGGGLAIDSINVDVNTAPANPVIPSNLGLITVTGAQVAAGTVGANAIRQNSSVVNAYTTEIQQGAAATPAAHTIAHNGICSFDSTTFTVTDGYVQSKGGVSLGTKNIGCKVVGSVFSICAADGSALSATNPGWVTLPSKANPGLFVKIAVTADQDVIFFGGASEIIGNLFGLTAANNWGIYQIPMFIYAVSNDAENAVAFMLSRCPSMPLSPVAAKIGMPSSAVCDTQGSFFSLEDIVAADYESNPVVLVGSCSGLFDQAGVNDWKLSVRNGYDGIGKFHDGGEYLYPTAVNGAAAGTHLLNNGGTAPVFTNTTYIYRIRTSGMIEVDFAIYGDGGTDGAGAVAALVSLPYVANESLKNGNIQTSGGGNDYLSMAELTSGAISCSLWAFNLGSLLNATFPAGDRAIIGGISFRMMDS